MKTYCIAVCIIGTILSANKLNAATLSPDGTENCSSYETVALSRPCQSASTGHMCTNNGDDLTNIKSCTSCPSGYTLKTYKLTDCCIEYSYGVCIGNCSSTCGNNTTEWTSTIGKGHETRVYEYCSGGTKCEQKTQYRCAAGYYGKSTNGTSGCTACPDRVLGATTTPSSGNETSLIISTIANCYFPAYKDITGDNGKYQYTETCYYQKDSITL